MPAYVKVNRTPVEWMEEMERALDELTQKSLNTVLIQSTDFLCLIFKITKLMGDARQIALVIYDVS
jgi:hypothetical protein